MNLKNLHSILLPLVWIKKVFLTKALEYILLTYKGIEVFNFFGDIKKNIVDFAQRISALEHKVEGLIHKDTKSVELTAPVVPPPAPPVVENKAPEQGAPDAT